MTVDDILVVDVPLLQSHGTMVQMTAAEADAVADRLDPEAFPEGAPLLDLIRAHTKVIADDRAGATYILVKIIAPRNTPAWPLG